jgi:hypothetical protein
MLVPLHEVGMGRFSLQVRKRRIILLLIGRMIYSDALRWELGSKW